MKCKKIISMVMILAVVLATSAFATVGSRTVELFYNNIKIMINGNEVKPIDVNGNAIEPFIIDGTTYLPVRGVASALGMNVGWDDTTKTITLDNPGVFQGGVQVYDDEKVTIDFVGCREKKVYSITTYYADFNIWNKTNATLTFQPKSISFDGISYRVSGSEEVAPQSTGKVSFYTDDGGVLPISGVSKTSGEIRVVDFSKSILDEGYTYDAKWVNITQNK